MPHLTSCEAITISPSVQSLIQEGRITDPGTPRGRLLRAAAHLFRTKGYQRTTVREMAALVGIQSGSLFHHFKSKEDILIHVMTETILICTEHLKAAIQDLAEPVQKLEALIRAELECVLGETGEAMTVLVQEWTSLSSSPRENLMDLRERYESIWIQVLVAMDKDVPLAMEPAILRKLLTGAIAWTINWFNPQGTMNSTELAKEVLKLAIPSRRK